MPGIRPNKPPPIIETPTQTTALTGAEMPDQLKNAIDKEEKAIAAKTPQLHPSSSSQHHPNGRTPLTNGNANIPGPPPSLTNGVNGSTDNKPPKSQQQPSRYLIPPIPGITPLKLTTENTKDLHLLGPEERDLCSTLRILPKPYLAIKEGIMKEALKNGGALKKRAVREVARVEAQKAARIFDFFVHAGWIVKA